MKLIAFANLFVWAYHVILVNALHTCTQSDKRTIYESCQLFYDDMTLWCDLTNFTKIPNPDDVRSYAPCALANALYINSSCIRDIDKGIAGGSGFFGEGPCGSEQLQRYTRLEKLDCSDNFLTKLKNDTFVHANKLQLIDVSNNEIAEVEKDSLKGLVNLRHLRIKRNRIAQLPDGTFDQAPNLEEIQLERNALVEMRSEVFSSLKNLQILSLQYNRMKSWAPDRNARFHSLLELDLGHNHLRSIGEDDLAAMPVLRRLILRNNRITKVNENAFLLNYDLLHIDLRNNRLRSLPRLLFVELCKLKVLRLNGNQLQTPHVEWFMNVVQHSSVEDHSTASFVSHNDWKCDCRSAKYWVFLQHFLNRDEDAWYNKLDVHCPGSYKFGTRTLNSCNQPSPDETELLLNKTQQFCRLRVKVTKSSYRPHFLRETPTEQRGSRSSYTLTAVLLCTTVAILSMIITLLLAMAIYKRKRQQRHSSTATQSRRKQTAEEKPLTKGIDV